jgi:class 3 adenylate cyclase
VDGRGPPADEGVRQVPARGPSLAAEGRARGALVTFLFADIRGYTRYTGRYGAEPAARLADAFVSIVSGVIGEHGGVLRGSWGDQVLVEFGSPRAAVRSAVELQARCMARTVEVPSLPLAVGVRIDVGEPAAEGVNQSAAALNLAARLCAKAGPGEVLATAELVHLAGAIDGTSYVDRGTVHFKGVSGAIRVLQVRDDHLDRDLNRRFRTALLGDHGTERHRTLTWAAGVLALVLEVALTAVVVLGRGDSGNVAVPPGGLAIVDADSGQVVDA